MASSHQCFLHFRITFTIIWRVARRWCNNRGDVHYFLKEKWDRLNFGPNWGTQGQTLGKAGLQSPVQVVFLTALLKIYFLESAFQHVEPRQSNWIPGDQKEVWRYGNSTIWSFLQKVTDGKRESTSNVASLNMQRHFRRTAYTRNRLFKHTMSLRQLTA